MRVPLAEDGTQEKPDDSPRSRSDSETNCLSQRTYLDHARVAAGPAPVPARRQAATRGPRRSRGPRGTVVRADHSDGGFARPCTQNGSYTPDHSHLARTAHAGLSQVDSGNS